MSTLSSGRARTVARTLGVLSFATLASLTLSACGGGGGDGSGTTPPPASPPQQNPPPSNVAPTANAGSAITIELPTDNATLSGSATDDGLPSGSTLTYTWAFVNGPMGPNNSPGVVFADANSASTSARFVGGPGTYTLDFKASDGSLTGASTLTVTVSNNPNNYPSAGAAGWTTVTPADEQMDPAKLDEAKNYSLTAGITGDEAGLIIRHGRIVYSWGDTTKRYEMKSTTKSMGGLAFLLALDEGKLTLTDKASAKLPVFGTDPTVDTSPVTTGGLADISLLHLATHTAGFSKSDAAPLLLNYTPGATWSYSDQGLNWLADVLTQTYAQDLNQLLFSKVFTTLGIEATDVTWRSNIYRSANLNVNGTTVARRELASGIDANVNAMARVGLLMLHKGVWANQSILSNAVVAQAVQPPSDVASATIADATNFPGATTNYGILWWTNTTGQISGVPTDAFWAWGLHETFIIVVPSLDLVVVRAGDHGWHADASMWNADYAVLAPFLTPIVQSVSP